MATRIHIIKLKPSANAPPEVFGWATTVTIPSEIPNLYQLQSHLQFFHEHAEFLVTLLGAAATLFPDQKKHASQLGPPPPTAA